MHKISIVIPTYNCAFSLEECLHSVRSQNYPRDLLELIIIDGFSTDSTREVASQYGAIILDNKDITHTSGRAIGIEQSSGELVLCIDSDNVLFGNDWLKKMSLPFLDPDIVAAEPLFYYANDTDNLITRYCALIGADDPIIALLGFHDRYSYLTGKWTEVPVCEKSTEHYLKIDFIDPSNIPSLGANGFLVRRDVLTGVKYNPFYHMDIAHQIIKNGGYWAKVKTGIIHRHAKSIGEYVFKKERRIKRRLKKGQDMGYIYPLKRSAVLKVVLKIVFVVPMFLDTVRAFLRKPTLIWLYHPFFVFATVLIYGYNLTVRRAFKGGDEKALD